MKLTVLGCQGPWPTGESGCSGYLLEAAGRRILLEAGSGTLAALGRLTDPMALDGVILSHLHFDHMGELPLLAYALMGTGRQLPVYLPDEPRAVAGLLSGFACFDCRTAAPGARADLAGLEVTFLPARHPVPAVGLRITDGERTLCYSGDTNTVEDLAGHYAGADLLLIDGGLSSAVWTPEKPHLSAALAAQTALDSGVPRCVLTHFAPGQRQLLLDEARAVLPSMEGALPGAVYVL